MTVSAAVYRMYDEAGALLYVGCSVRWPIRLGAHSTNKEWWKDVRNITVEPFADDAAAMLAEAQAQRDENPVYNIIRNGRRAPKTEPATADPIALGCSACGAVVRQNDSHDCTGPFHTLPTAADVLAFRLRFTGRGDEATDVENARAVMGEHV